LKVAEFNIAT